MEMEYLIKSQHPQGGQLVQSQPSYPEDND